MNLSESETRTMLAVFGELLRKPHRELNTFLGNLTIEEMTTLYWKCKRELGLCEEEQQLID